MTKLKTLAALLATTAIFGPAQAFAQDTAPPASPSASQVGDPQDENQEQDTLEAANPGADDQPPEQSVEISGPGADSDEPIVIRGTYIPSPVRATPEVVSVLSAEDIARTGDGDIAGALQRVTGLSVVGGRFVYVRGLGERYSSALLNGAPLPSPEPLRRVVPLDLFPTSIVASTVVQKSYSANFPGEFGGGVINLTTRSAPREGFLSVGGGLGFNSETSLNLGYTYFGSDTDFLGFDDGNRDAPLLFREALDSGNRIIQGADYSRQQIADITSSLDNASTSLIQKTYDVPVNWSADIGAGETFELGALDLGVIAVGGISNSWRTRSGQQQAGTRSGDNSLVASSDFDYLSTQNRVVVNGMASTVFKLDDQTLRLTGLYIRDVLKEARASIGNNFDSVQPSALRPDETIQTGSTNWFERELYDAQAVAEFEFGDFNLDLRGSYAKTRRDAPYERSYSYLFDDGIEDYVNDLRSPAQNATVSFSELDDELWYGAIDAAYYVDVGVPVTLSAGYAHSDNSRAAIRRDFQFRPNATLPFAVAQERIDYLLSDYNVNTYDILLRETTGGLGSAAYEAALVVDGVYGMLEIEPTRDILVNIGVRYEDAEQSLTPQILFGQPAADQTQILADYLLPAGTLTWNFADDMQLRIGASKTIARPQFRELAPQPYVDFETQRTFFGNPYLTDSKILNLDARYEYYFGRDEIFSLAGFYKKLDNPIETIAANVGSSLISTFANAPGAELYGAEVEFRKYLPFYDMGVESGLLTDRRVTFIANYTYTQSELFFDEGETTVLFSSPTPLPVEQIFDTTQTLGLTGQSEHVANLQFGFEHEDRLSQQTLILAYASDRSTNRGPNRTPDFIEEPGLQLDVVLREGVDVGGTELEIKAEGRNLLDTDYKEAQSLGDSELIILDYERGRTFNLSATLTF
ncbi:TonB-dependent receptor [Sphingomicrobium sp. XHP0235]|uniref:TonB-dependent receptor domain-containing protein n=1 Tax=Sphingomicrobium aquimarinum TaxID=3133971 RepID=UPI0031FED89F